MFPRICRFVFFVVALGQPMVDCATRYPETFGSVPFRIGGQLEGVGGFAGMASGAAGPSGLASGIGQGPNYGNEFGSGYEQQPFGYGGPVDAGFVCAGPIGAALYRWDANGPTLGYGTAATLRYCAVETLPIFDCSGKTEIAPELRNADGPRPGGGSGPGIGWGSWSGPEIGYGSGLGPGIGYGGGLGPGNGYGGGLSQGIGYGGGLGPGIAYGGMSGPENSYGNRLGPGVGYGGGLGPGVGYGGGPGPGIVYGGGPGPGSSYGSVPQIAKSGVAHFGGTFSPRPSVTPDPRKTTRNSNQNTNININNDVGKHRRRRLGRRNLEEVSVV